MVPPKKSLGALWIKDYFVHAVKLRQNLTNINAAFATLIRKISIIEWFYDLCAIKSPNIFLTINISSFRRNSERSNMKTFDNSEVKVGKLNVQMEKSRNFAINIEEKITNSSKLTWKGMSLFAKKEIASFKIDKSLLKT